MVKNHGPILPYIDFVLSPSVQVRRVEIIQNGQVRPAQNVERVAGDENVELGKGSTSGSENQQIVRVRLDQPLESGSTLVMEWECEGKVNNPPQLSRRLRFVTPNSTAGHIGPEGVFLSGETQWYPDLPGSLATFDVNVTVPKGWEPVTHGREVLRQGWFRRSGHGSWWLTGS